MKSCEILAEFHRLPSLDQRKIDWLCRQGVPPMALAMPWVLRADAVVLMGRRFEFAKYNACDEAQAAIIFLGFDINDELIDLVAWCPKSDAVANWIGRIPLLGAEQIEFARLGEPFVVHGDVLSWLKADRQGCVVVDAERAGSILREAGPLAVADQKQARRLRDVLTVQLPTIVVVERRRVAA